jgi:hypothetical protein
VWAAKDNKTLKMGAMIGGALATVVVFLLGFGGLLAYWSGRATEESNSNFGFFLAFSQSTQFSSTAVVSTLLPSRLSTKDVE